MNQETAMEWQSRVWWMTVMGVLIKVVFPTLENCDPILDHLGICTSANKDMSDYLKYVGYS